MSKYIIEVGDAYVRHALGRKLIIPVIINNDTEYWVDTNIQLTLYTEPDIEKVRKEAYEKGLADAWEAARKILQMHDLAVFGLGHDGVFESPLNEGQQMTPQEAIEKLKAYEQEKEERLEVGDEVRNVKNGWTAVVSNIDGECMTLMDTNGALGDGYDVNRFTKTGRHFPEIAAVLEKMRGGQDE